LREFLMSDGPLHLTSGDPVVDRRLEWARALIEEGNAADAAHLLLEVTARAPDFLPLWFLLAEAREKAGDPDGAAGAYVRALRADPDDPLGAGVRLARLGRDRVEAKMSEAYVRTLFDQYAGRFDEALARLDYRGPELIHDALGAACDTLGRPFAFDHGLDLGCGTGLVGAALAGKVGRLDGVDLSPNMIEQTRHRGGYDRLEVMDMLAFVERQTTQTADLVFAGDAFCYLDDLAPILKESARVVEAGGLLAFTVETHNGEGVILRDTLRYAHAEAYVRERLAEAGFSLVSLEHASTRKEGTVPVPGLVVVAERQSTSST
jgi:predicted TPR repeat methyltransferase